MREFHGIMGELLAGMRKQRPAESSIAAHLLDIKDPDTGASTPSIKPAMSRTESMHAPAEHAMHCLLLC